MAKKKKPTIKSASSNQFNNLGNADTETLQKRLEELELLNNYQGFSIPKSLQNITSNDSIPLTNRDMEYRQRYEMYNDTFTRDMVKVVITRAIGATHDNVKPFEIKLKDDTKVDDKLKEVITKEFKYLVDLIEVDLMDITLDSQFLGDGYARPIFEKGKGVTKILRNISTSPFNITAIVDNRDETIAYEVGRSNSVFEKPKKDYQQNYENVSSQKNGRTYVSKYDVVRVNAKGNGIINVTDEQFYQLDRMNVFDNNQHLYEDGIYGGVMEGCYNDFINYIWSIRALSQARIASATIERFITMALNATTENERKLLKTSFENAMKDSMKKLKSKINNKDPDLLITNHVIPTTSDGTGGVSIQESTPSVTGFQSIEDIMVQIRKFLGAVGFNIEMTSFAGMSIGGGEKEGVFQNSLQMDANAVDIRKAIRGYVTDIVKIHFLSKYNLEISNDNYEINFTSVINKSKMDAEQQRMENITNTQQISTVIEGFKSLAVERNPKSELAMRAILEDVISQSSKHKEEQLDVFIDAIFQKPTEDEGV